MYSVALSRICALEACLTEATFSLSQKALLQRVLLILLSKEYTKIHGVSVKVYKTYCYLCLLYTPD